MVTFVSTKAVGRRTIRGKCGAVARTKLDLASTQPFCRQTGTYAPMPMPQHLRRKTQHLCGALTRQCVQNIHATCGPRWETMVVSASTVVRRATKATRLRQCGARQRRMLQTSSRDVEYHVIRLVWHNSLRVWCPTIDAISLASHPLLLAAILGQENERAVGPNSIAGLAHR
jgi:hypothetical protein